MSKLKKITDIFNIINQDYSMLELVEKTIEREKKLRNLKICNFHHDYQTITNKIKKMMYQTNIKYFIIDIFENYMDNNFFVLIDLYDKEYFSSKDFKELEILQNECHHEILIKHWYIEERYLKIKFIVFFKFKSSQFYFCFKNKYEKAILNCSLSKNIY